MEILENFKKNATYGCSDPRMHPRELVSVSKATNDAAERHKKDFESLHGMIDDYVSDHGCIPYCVVLQLLAVRYLGAGIFNAELKDYDYPNRSSKSFSCMFWNLGN